MGQFGTPLILRNSRHFEVGAKYADIGISVNGNATDAKVEPEDLFYGVMKRVVVNSVAAVQQCSIDVEEVSVCSFPIEAGLYINRRSPACCNFGSTCPSSLQFRTGSGR